MYLVLCSVQVSRAENCVDRHALSQGDRTALIWETDDGESVKVCCIASALTYRYRTLNSWTKFAASRTFLRAMA